MSGILQHWPAGLELPNGGKSKLQCLRQQRGGRVRKVLVAIVCAVAGSVQAATILERTIEVQLQDGSMVKRLHLVVAIEEPGDITTWSSYSVDLDQHLTLLECTAEILDGNGKVRARVPRRSFERVSSTGFGLYSSSWSEVIPFPGLHEGERLRIDLTVRIDPPYRASEIPLSLPTRQRRLSVTVRGGGEFFRWQLPAIPETITIAELEGGLDLSGTDLKAADSLATTLRLAWDHRANWAGVGTWYSELADRLPAPSPEVRELALSLCQDLDRRACFEALADHVRHKVRYEAVSIGAGRWTPSPSGVVARRGWGDCKDKSHLLRDLLEVVGMASHLVLIKAGLTLPIDPGFPASNRFNHCILAVPVSQFLIGPEDPVVDGLFFLDPGMDRGGVSWLTPSCQGRVALVAAGSKSRLVEIPDLFRREQRQMNLSGKVTDDGSLKAEVTLRFLGQAAVLWLRWIDTLTGASIEEKVRMELQLHLMPGSDITGVKWRELLGQSPGVELSAAISLVGAVRGDVGRRWLRFAFSDILPEPGRFDPDALPVRLSAGVFGSHWHLDLPHDWCPAMASQWLTQNLLGRLRVVVKSGDGNSIEITQELELRRSWFSRDHFTAIRELATAESRAARRRIRLRCGPPPTT